MNIDQFNDAERKDIHCLEKINIPHYIAMAVYGLIVIGGWFYQQHLIAHIQAQTAEPIITKPDLIAMFRSFFSMYLLSLIILILYCISFIVTNIRFRGLIYKLLEKK